MKFQPGDKVVWFKVMQGSYYKCQKIPAQVIRHKPPSRVVIQRKDLGEKFGKITYVMPEQLEHVKQ